MKNKLTVLLLALVLVITLFALASCGETADTTSGESTTTEGVGTTALTTTEAPKKENPMTGDDALAAFLYADAKMDMVMEVVTGFEFLAVEENTYAGLTDRTEMEMKIAYTDGEARLFISMDMEGSPVEMIYVDGVVYTKMSMYDRVWKTKSTDNSSVESIRNGVENIFSSNDEYGYDDVVSAEFVSRADGLYVIKAVISDEMAYQMLKESLAVDESDLCDVSAIITCECDANGLVSKMIEEYTYTLDGEAYKKVITATFKNFGVMPIIIAPEDADEYVDMDNVQE